MKETMENRVENLLLRIGAAFEGVPRPRITKSVARGYDDEWNLSDERIAELQALDPEKRWQEIDEDGIRLYQEYFFFSDAEGWRFYLPAHMTYYLRNFPDYGWDAVYTALCNPESKLAALSPDQRSCVQQFIDLVHEEGLRKQT